MLILLLATAQWKSVCVSALFREILPLVRVCVQLSVTTCSCAQREPWSVGRSTTSRRVESTPITGNSLPPDLCSPCTPSVADNVGPSSRRCMSKPNRSYQNQTERLYSLFNGPLWSDVPIK